MFGIIANGCLILFSVRARNLLSLLKTIDCTMSLHVFTHQKNDAHNLFRYQFGHGCLMNFCIDVKSITVSLWHTNPCCKHLFICFLNDIFMDYEQNGTQMSAAIPPLPFSLLSDSFPQGLFLNDLGLALALF